MPEPTMIHCRMEIFSDLFDTFLFVDWFAKSRMKALELKVLPMPVRAEDILLRMNLVASLDLIFFANEHSLFAVRSAIFAKNCCFLDLFTFCDFLDSDWLVILARSFLIGQ